MNRSGIERHRIKEKYPNAFCYKCVGGKFYRYAVKLDQRAEVVAGGVTAGMAWRKAYRELVRTKLL